MTVKLGLIGAGEMVRIVAGMVVRANEEVSISAVFDPSESALLACRKTFGDEFIKANSVSELLGDDSVNWVFVAS